VFGMVCMTVDKYQVSVELDGEQLTVNVTVVASMTRSAIRSTLQLTRLHQLPHCLHLFAHHVPNFLTRRG
jgi:hypothetical protein